MPTKPYELGTGGPSLTKPLPAGPGDTASQDYMIWYNALPESTKAYAAKPGAQADAQNAMAAQSDAIFAAQGNNDPWATQPNPTLDLTTVPGGGSTYNPGVGSQDAAGYIPQTLASTTAGAGAAPQATKSYSGSPAPQNSNPYSAALGGTGGPQGLAKTTSNQGFSVGGGTVGGTPNVPQPAPAPSGGAGVPVNNGGAAPSPYPAGTSNATQQYYQQSQITAPLPYNWYKDHFQQNQNLDDAGNSTQPSITEQQWNAMTPDQQWGQVQNTSYGVDTNDPFYKQVNSRYNQAGYQGNGVIVNGQDGSRIKDPKRVWTDPQTGISMTDKDNITEYSSGVDPRFIAAFAALAGGGMLAGLGEAGAAAGSTLAETTAGAGATEAVAGGASQGLLDAGTASIASQADAAAAAAAGGASALAPSAIPIAGGAAAATAGGAGMSSILNNPIGRILAGAGVSSVLNGNKPGQGAVPTGNNNGIDLSSLLNTGANTYFDNKSIDDFMRQIQSYLDKGDWNTFRPVGLEQLARSFTDPESMLQDPTFRASRERRLGDTSRAMNARGMALSGNELGELTSLGTQLDYDQLHTVRNDLINATQMGNPSGLYSAAMGSANTALQARSNRNASTRAALERALGQSGVSSNIVTQILDQIFGKGNGGGSGSETGVDVTGEDDGPVGPPYNPPPDDEGYDVGDDGVVYY